MKLSRTQLESLLQDARLDHKGTNLYAICPMCGHDEFGISLSDNHVYNCFRSSNCGAKGNIFTLLKFLGRAKEFLSEREIHVFEKLESGLIDDNEIIDLSLPEMREPLLWKRIYNDDYLNERGFSAYQYKKFEVGVSSLKKDYITFLIRRDDKIVGHVSRSKKTKIWIDEYNRKQKESGSKLVYLRYNNSTTDFSKTLFGIDEIIPGVTTDVILVEGIFSKTKTDLNLELDNGDTLKCCATFGAKLSVHQIELLKIKGVKNIWLWFESDVLEKIKKIAAQASLFFNVKVSYLGDKDPNDINQEEAIELLDNAKDYLNFNMNYITGDLKW